MPLFLALAPLPLFSFPAFHPTQQEEESENQKKNKRKSVHTHVVYITKNRKDIAISHHSPLSPFPLPYFRMLYDQEINDLWRIEVNTVYLILEDRRRRRLVLQKTSCLFFLKRFIAAPPLPIKTKKFHRNNREKARAEFLHTSITCLHSRLEIWHAPDPSLMPIFHRGWKPGEHILS